MRLKKCGMPATGARKRYLVGLQFDTHWMQIGVYAKCQWDAGDIAVREFRIDRPPFVTSITYRGELASEGLIGITVTHPKIVK